MNTLQKKKKKKKKKTSTNATERCPQLNDSEILLIKSIADKIVQTIIIIVKITI